MTDEETLRIRLEEEGLKELSLLQKARKSREKAHLSGYQSNQREEAERTLIGYDQWLTRFLE